MAIVVALQVKLTEGEQARMRHRSTNNLHAWSYAVRAWSLFQHFTGSDNAKAQELTQRAIELDPEYAWAWTTLAWTFWYDAFFGPKSSRADSLKRAFEIAQKALALDDSQPDVYALLGFLYLLRRQHDQAIDAGRRAIELGPNNADSYGILAMILRYAGKWNETITLSEKAMRLHPYYPHWYLNSLGHAFRFSGEYEKAITTHKKWLERVKGTDFAFSPHLNLACVYSELGRDEEAQAHVAAARRINSDYNLEEAQTLTYKDSAHLARFIECLRKTGLK